MRIANLRGRLVLIDGTTALDVETASGGKFSSNPQAVYKDWVAFRDWAVGADLSAAEPFAAEDLGAPVPSPGQIFGIGLNYRAHAAESGQPEPDFPLVFTKFQSSITGPAASITLPSEKVDWEVELVVVIGRTARSVSAAEAWSYVAGLTVGQDISERAVQLRGPAPQFSMGKSYPDFSPIGPAVVTADELGDPEALRIRAEVEGPGVEGVLSLQDGNTNDLIFSVPALIEYLSGILTLSPGDIIFTGTPSGVGMGRTPKMFLQKGQVLTSTIEGIGQLRNPLV